MGSVSAEALAQLRADVAGVAAKQRSTDAATHGHLGALITGLERCRAAISADDSALRPAVAALAEQVAHSQPLAALQAEHKELQSALAKASKAVDRALYVDLARLPRQLDVEIPPDALHTALIAHLCAQGWFDVARVFAEECGVALPEDLLASYETMHRILADIARGETASALEWAASKRDALAAIESPLEFELHQLGCVRCVLAGDIAGAVRYARDHFGPHAEKHMDEIGRVMGLLVYGQRLARYGPLLRAGADVARRFRSDYTALLGRGIESPLPAAVDAGVAALPTLLKLASVMGHAGAAESLSAADTLPVEVELGDAHRYHSIFACPVSREQASAGNPPVMLPCGHVLCRDSVDKIVTGASRGRGASRQRVSCPYCPYEGPAEDVRQVRF